MRMRDFDIALHNLQIAQHDKSRPTTTRLLSVAPMKLFWAQFVSMYFLA